MIDERALKMLIAKSCDDRPAKLTRSLRAARAHPFDHFAHCGAIIHSAHVALLARQCCNSCKHEKTRRFFIDFTRSQV
jgi:hypothetical protein